MTLAFWERKGLSKDEAIFKIKSQRKTNKEYWLSRGFSDDESKKIYQNFKKVIVLN
jgi:hypothetical protein